MSEHGREENVETQSVMDGGMTILMILFAFASAALIIYFNYMFNAIEGFGAPPFIIAFCVGVGAVICFGALNAIARGGKGEDTVKKNHS